MNEELIKHHEFSPSKLERIENCPPSWKICKGFTGSEGKDASRGTLMHLAFYDDKALSQLSEQDKDIIAAIRAEHLEPFQKPGIEHFHELFVSLKDNDGTELTTGTLDYLMLDKTKTVGSITDLKFGNYEVTPAESNIQIMAYVAGVFQLFPTLERVFALIVQPAYGIGDFQEQAEFCRSGLSAIVDRIKNIIENAKNADINDLNQYRCSADNCRYCNKIGCPAYRQWMTENMTILGVAHNDIPQEVAEMTVEYADRIKCAYKAVNDEMAYLTGLADNVIIECGGSENFKKCDGKKIRRIDWKGLCNKHNISEDEIARFTVERQGNPYLMPRMRKNNKKIGM